MARRGVDLDGVTIDLGLWEAVGHSAGHVEFSGGFGDVDHSSEGIAAVFDHSFDVAGLGVVFSDKVSLGGFAAEDDPLGHGEGHDGREEDDGAVGVGSHVLHFGVVISLVGEIGLDSEADDVGDVSVGLGLHGFPFLVGVDGPDDGEDDEQNDAADNGEADDFSLGDVDRRRIGRSIW